jgi:hypothetical protein
LSSSRTIASGARALTRWHSLPRQMAWSRVISRRAFSVQRRPRAGRDNAISQRFVFHQLRGHGRRFQAPGRRDGARAGGRGVGAGTRCGRRPVRHVHRQPAIGSFLGAADGLQAARNHLPEATSLVDAAIGGGPPSCRPYQLGLLLTSTVSLALARPPAASGLPLWPLDPSYLLGLSTPQFCSAFTG